MHDDVTRGATGPIEADGGAWLREATIGRQEFRMAEAMRVGLTAVVLSVRQEQPVAMVTDAKLRSGSAAGRLPGGRFYPVGQTSLEAALREHVLETSGRELGYLEQLLTDFGPAEPGSLDAIDGARQLSVSYLALTRADNLPLEAGTRWLECYELLPWEDFRGGRPAVLAQTILPGLEAWARDVSASQDSADCETPMSRVEQVAVSFGLSGRTWDDQRVVDRFDLLHEAGLLPAASTAALSPAGLRLVAAGLGRLRAKIRYRPVVFELLAPEFTLFELQRTVEAVLGPTLHKQNFRRLVEGTGLVEPTGDVRNNTGGRPAKTFRFRREVLLERPAPGVHVRPGRAA
ncbi:MAG: NAD regulator [Hyphomicrobiaceae bacterium]